ncbi:MAG: toxin C-terminal domain-containing protein [Erysipelotrichaceae bacterium]|nr:toxin C-terminal domain-containing protein [Erysipelotrichaceae bacterium]
MTRKTYNSPDADAHKGGVWKMAKKLSDILSDNKRLGTFDEFLKWIGD